MSDKTHTCLTSLMIFIRRVVKKAFTWSGWPNNLALEPGCEEMEREWGENEEMERDWLSTFPHSLSISSLSYIKNVHNLSQNVKYGTFVANVTKILKYAQWGNNSGSNLLRGSFASCAGLGRAQTSRFSVFTRGRKELWAENAKNMLNMLNIKYERNSEEAVSL